MAIRRYKRHPQEDGTFIITDSRFGVMQSWREDAEGNPLDRHAKPAGPSLPRKAVNYAKAQVRHTINGRPKASDAVVDQRFAICSSDQCGLYNPLTVVDGPPVGKCLSKSCGCYLRPAASDEGEKNKLRHADEECPAGLWQPQVAGFGSHD